jgi:hypothetical protein
MPTIRSMMTPALQRVLESSHATQEFKSAVQQYAEGNATTPLIRASAGAPPVKVLRVITKLLESHPQVAFKSVDIQATSGCSDFRGTLKADADSPLTIRFVWDCAWKARQVGYADHWGEPDQIRAAQEFGYDCFEVFEAS